jgi:glycosyltransferase involved in cell wall biosynthesis
LAFLGRICPEKGLEAAVRVASASGMPLRIAAKVDAADQAYYAEKIRPWLRQPGLEFVGEISQQQMGGFLGGAAALLFPIDWPEPFGLVMIEAMACGTPVIAFDRGSVSEVVEHGISGFIAEDEAEAVAAVERLASLDRGRVRDAFERRFTSARMARDYVQLYESLVGVGRTISAPNVRQDAGVADCAPNEIRPALLVSQSSQQRGCPDERGADKRPLESDREPREAAVGRGYGG